MGVTSHTNRASAASEGWRLMSELWQGQRRRLVAVASEFDLSRPQMAALRSLDPDREMPMNELAVALHCDNSNVTGIIDRLEDRGLVERRPAGHDRRVKHLALTARGAEVRQALVARMDQPPEAIASLSAADQRALRDILRRALRR